MKTKWIEYHGTKILYQDYSDYFFNEEAVKEELAAAQAIVLSEPENSVLVLSNMSNTEVTLNLMALFNEASRATKSHVKKTAVLGVAGIKRTLGDLLSRITGQPLMYFNNEIEANEWLAKP